MQESALRTRNFLLYLVGRGVSSLGDYFGDIALSIFVYVGTGSPLLLAIASLAFAAPRSVVRLLLGVYVDRLGKREVMIATELTRGFIFLLLSILGFLGMLSVLIVYASLIAVGSLRALFELSGEAFLPEIVRKDFIFRANSVLTAVLQADSVVGPALAGISISVLGITPSLIIDSSSFFFLAFCLLMIRVARVAVQARKLTWTQDFREGINFFRKRKELFWLSFSFTIVNFGMGGFYNVYTFIYAYNYLNVGSFGWGLLNAMNSLGIVVMAAYLARRKEIRRKKLAMVLSIVSISFFLFALSFQSSLIAASICMYFIGSSVPVSSVIISSYYQTTVPKEVLGRIVGMRQLISFISIPFGIIFAGIIPYYASIQQDFLITSAIVVAGSLPLLAKKISVIDS